MKQDFSKYDLKQTLSNNKGKFLLKISNEINRLHFSKYHLKHISPDPKQISQNIKWSRLHFWKYHLKETSPVLNQISQNINWNKTSKNVYISQNLPFYNTKVCQQNPHKLQFMNLFWNNCIQNICNYTLFLTNPMKHLHLGGGKLKISLNTTALEDSCIYGWILSRPPFMWCNIFLRRGTSLWQHCRQAVVRHPLRLPLKNPDMISLFREEFDGSIYWSPSLGKW